MLTGEKLFQGQPPPSVMMAHFNPLVFPSSWPEGVPSDLPQVLEMALVKQPEDRYATAIDLATALNGLAHVEHKTAPDAATSTGVAIKNKERPQYPDIHG